MQRQREGRYLLILFEDSRMKSNEPSGKQDARTVWYVTLNNSFQYLNTF